MEAVCNLSAIGSQHNVSSFAPKIDNPSFSKNNKKSINRHRLPRHGRLDGNGFLERYKRQQNVSPGIIAFNMKQIILRAIFTESYSLGLTE